MKKLLLNRKLQTYVCVYHEYIYIKFILQDLSIDCLINLSITYFKS